MNRQEIVVQDQNNKLEVLKLVSPAKNSETQFYYKKVLVNKNSIVDINKKILYKLKLNKVEARASVLVEFEKDRVVEFDSIADFDAYDLKIAQRTNLVAIKWSFLFDSTGEGQEHLHSVYLRISQQPNPGLLLQKILSNRTEDIASLDNDAFAPIACKLDFSDSRFSNELLAVVTDWVDALPKAESTFGLVNWLRKNDDKIGAFILGTFPGVMLLTLAAAWLLVAPADQYAMIKYGYVWLLFCGFAFLFSRYISNLFVKFFSTNIRRISNVPIFDITSGDGNRLTKYSASSHKSMFKLAGGGLLYGASKAAGFYVIQRALSAIFG